MGKHLILAAFLWALCGSGGVACSSTEELSTSASITAEVYCQRGCATLEGCASASATSACTVACQQDLAKLSEPRGDLLSYIATCVEAAECKDKASSPSPCKDEALAVLAPSNAGHDLCTNYEQKSVMCKADFEKAKCFEAAKTYPDDTLSEASACVSKAACGGVRACFLSNLPLFEPPQFKPGI